MRQTALIDTAGHYIELEAGPGEQISPPGRLGSKNDSALLGFPDHAEAFIRRSMGWQDWGTEAGIPLLVIAIENKAAPGNSRENGVAGR